MQPRYKAEKNICKEDQNTITFISLQLTSDFTHIMKDLFIGLFLVSLSKINMVGAAGTSLREEIACPKVTFSAQDTSTHLDDIHHLECQLGISREHKRFKDLREEAHSVSDNLDKTLKSLIEKTLSICRQVHKDLIEPEMRSYRAQLSEWAPMIFNSPIERFVSCGQNFLDGLEPLKHKALRLANMNEHDISGCVLTLKAYCQDSLAPCMGDDTFNSRTPRRCHTGSKRVDNGSS